MRKLLIIPFLSSFLLVPAHFGSSPSRILFTIDIAARACHAFISNNFPVDKYTLRIAITIYKYGLDCPLFGGFEKHNLIVTRREKLNDGRGVQKKHQK